MADKKYTVPANDSITPGINARYIYVKDITVGASVRMIGSGKGGSFDYTVNKGSKIGPTHFDITDIEIINETGSAIDIDLRTGQVSYDENVLSGEVSISAPGDLLDAADASVLATTVTSIMAANLDRKEAIITALSTNTADARIGSSSIGSARGIVLAPGQATILETTSQIYAWSSAAASFSISYTE